MTDVTFRTGQFVWREIMTKDVSASTRFYTEVLGWKTQTADMPDGKAYTMLQAGEQGVGGLMQVPDPSMPAFWTGYVSVADVEDTAKRATAAGGKVLAGPMDAGGFGRFVCLQDPQGAVINGWKGSQGDGPARERPGVGEFCWEQLATTDLAAAQAFYAKTFGWTEKPMDADPGIKVYSAGAVQVASVMPTPPGVPPHWLSYVIVDKLASTYARVKQHGGKVMVEKIEVPSVGTIGVIQDNVGAMLGLFENPAG